jgi:hypothetical protein
MNRSLIEITRKAMGYRIDVEHCFYRIDADDEFDIYVQLSNGQRKKIHVVTKTLTDGRTCGQIIHDWLGPESESNMNRRQTAWIQERKRYMEHTPDQLIQMAIEHGRSVSPVLDQDMP